MNKFWPKRKSEDRLVKFPMSLEVKDGNIDVEVVETMREALAHEVASQSYPRPEPHIVDKYVGETRVLIDGLIQNANYLEAEIARLTRHLDETKTSITAFSAAMAVFNDDTGTLNYDAGVAVDTAS